MRRAGSARTNASCRPSGDQLGTAANPLPLIALDAAAVGIRHEHGAHALAIGVERDPRPSGDGRG